MHGLPNTFEVVHAIANVIREEDTSKKEKSVTVPAITCDIQGICVIQKVGVEDTYIPIGVSNDADYNALHYVSGRKQPGATILEFTNGDISIIVDDVFMEWHSEDAPVWKKSLSEAILCHELGHYIAGHLDTKPDLLLDRTNNDEYKKANDAFPAITKALLEGAVFDIELEASTYAMRIIDDPMKIVAMHSYLAATSDTLGMRMQNSNMVDRLVSVLEDDEWEKYDECTDDLLIQIHFSKQKTER